ncbi:MAG: hypothetical protein ABSC51_02665 [Gaiellaceae bacterium]|jgi:hypothetical protein
MRIREAGSRDELDRGPRCLADPTITSCRFRPQYDDRAEARWGLFDLRWIIGWKKLHDMHSEIAVDSPSE